jgi:transposase
MGKRIRRSAAITSRCGGSKRSAFARTAAKRVKKCIRRAREDIKDLPIGAYAVELKVRVEQFKCRGCDRAFTPQIPFLAEGAHATERFLERAAELIRNGDIASVAKFYGLWEQTLVRW